MSSAQKLDGDESAPSSMCVSAGFRWIWKARQLLHLLHVVMACAAGPICELQLPAQFLTSYADQPLRKHAWIRL
jgi:hypothetical protein